MPCATSPLTLAFQTLAHQWRVPEPDPLEAAGQAGTGEMPGGFERLCYAALAERIIDIGKACELLQKSHAEIERKPDAASGSICVSCYFPATSCCH